MERMLGFAASVFEKTRLRMLKVLMERELCVCELAALFRLSSARVSQHLQILRRAGAVNERREGKWVHYAADAEALAAFTRAWQEYLRAGLDEIPDLAEEAGALNSEELRSVREGCDGRGRMRVRATS